MFFSVFNEEVREVFNEDKDKFLVMSWIIFRTNYQDEYEELKCNQCYFSYSALEKELNLSHRKLIRIMNDLEISGFISWAFKSKTRHKQSVLNLLKERTSKSTSKGTSKRIGKDVKNTMVTINMESVKEPVEALVKEPSSKNISKNSISDIDYQIFFEELWSLYPNKKGKAKSRELVYKILAKYSKDELKRAVERYSNSCGTDIKYIKHGSSFFNGGFEDYLDVNYVEDKKALRKSVIPSNFDY